MPVVTDEHCQVKGFLLCTVGAFVEERRLGTIHHSPFQMKTGPDLPGRAPDLLFVTRRNERRLRQMYLDGPADLVVEIVGDDDGHTERVDKFREYEQGGVREYWLIDP